MIARWFDGWGTGYETKLADGRTLYICSVGAGLYSGSTQPEARPNGDYLAYFPRKVAAFYDALLCGGKSEREAADIAAEVR